MRKKNIDWSDHSDLLGKVSDSEIAASLGCNIAAVRNKRFRDGILVGTSYEYVDWSKWGCLVGTMSDSGLSKLIGCHRATVSTHRRSKGIAPANQWPWSEEDESFSKSDLRRCLWCRNVKSLSEFPTSGKRGRDGRKRACRECLNHRQRVLRIETKKQFVRLLGGCCQNCGYDRYFESLQFHHVDQASKLFEIANKLDRPAQIESAKSELDKCVLLCANCHFAFHGSELKLSFFKLTGIGWSVIKHSSGDALDSQTCLTEDKDSTFRVLREKDDV